MKTKIASKNGIIFLTLCDYTDEVEAERIIEQLEKFFAGAKRHLSILVFLNCYQGSSSKTRFLAGEFLKNKTDQISKVALVGNQNKPFELAAMVVMALSGFRNFKFFSNRQEALAWFQSEE